METNVTKGRKRPIGFVKPNVKKSNELFIEEKAKFLNIPNNEYSEVLSKSSSIKEALSLFDAKICEIEKNIKIWESKAYKNNNTIVSGYCSDDCGRMYSTTISSANERRRINTIRRLQHDIDTINEYKRLLKVRCNA